MIIIVTKEELRHAHRVMRGELLKRLADKAKTLDEYNCTISLPLDMVHYGGLTMSSKDGKVVSFDNPYINNKINAHPIPTHYSAHELPTWLLRKFDDLAQRDLEEIL